MRNYILLLAILIFSSYSFTQNTDSLKPKTFENFFGSNCDVDTLTESFGKHSRIVLFSNEYKLCKFKKEKLVSTISLLEFSESDYLCMMLIPKSYKSKKKHYAVIFSYKNDEEIGREMIEYPS